MFLHVLLSIILIANQLKISFVIYCYVTTTKTLINDDWTELVIPQGSFSFFTEYSVASYI